MKKLLWYNVKNIYYIFMEYENVVLKGYMIDYEYGCKEFVRIIIEIWNCIDGRWKIICFWFNILMLLKNFVNNCFW